MIVELTLVEVVAVEVVLVDLAVTDEEKEILDDTLAVWLVVDAVPDVEAKELIEEFDVVDVALSVESEVVVAVVEGDTVIVGCQYDTEVLVLVLGGSGSIGNVMLAVYEPSFSASTKRLPRSSSSSVLRMSSMASVAAVLLLAR